MTRITKLTDRLRRLSGDNPVSYVKVLPEDWAELDGILADAERYRWLRDLPEGNPDNQIVESPGDMWDMAIDAAMQQPKE